MLVTSAVGCGRRYTILRVAFCPYLMDETVGARHSNVRTATLRQA
jgi:hypothetical protein